MAKKTDEGNDINKNINPSLGDANSPESADLKEEVTPITFTEEVGEEQIIVIGAMNITHALKQLEKRKFKMVILVPFANKQIVKNYAQRARSNIKSLMSQSFASGIYLVDEEPTIPNITKMMNRCHLNTQFRLNSADLISLIELAEKLTPTLTIKDETSERVIMALSRLIDVVNYANQCGFEFAKLGLELASAAFIKEATDKANEKLSE